MTPLHSAREALFNEAIGEMAAVVNRVEAVAHGLEAGRLALLQASTDLSAQLAAFDTRMAGITEAAKVQSVRHIALRADEVARGAFQVQVRAMEEAGRTLFRSELNPALQRVVEPMQQLIDLSKRTAHPWQLWLTYAATALVSSGCTWALAAWLWLR